MNRSITGTSYLSDPGLLIRQWAGEDAAVVFSPRSTNTYLISRQASELLNLASASPVSQDQIDQAFGVGPDTESQLTSLMDGLLAVGLLRQSQ